MQTRSRRTVAYAGTAALAVVLTACGGSSGGGGTSGGTPQPEKFQKIALNNTGTPVQGGTLNVLSSSDTDYLDPNITYYSLGYSYVREFSRQLYSYAANSGHQTDIVPDLATDMPNVSSDGKTYRVTIKKGAMWNTTPPRQVTAEDVVRGVKSTCNSFQPFGGLPDFNFLIVGFKKFCDGYDPNKTDAGSIAAYANSHDIPGVTVDKSDPLTVEFHLTQPATFFVNQLALPAFSPRAKEMDAYAPGSPQAAQHTVSDGPYQVQSYTPTKKIVYTRNKAWDRSTDSLRKAYVDQIVITMTNSDPEVSLKQVRTNDPSADTMMNGVPATDVNSLLSDPRLNVESEIASNPYVLFNNASPNNGGALGKDEVRQAISYALNRQHLTTVAGGPKLSPPLTHVLPPEINGSVPIDLYPYDVNKAKDMLSAAGVSNLTLKFLYRPSSPTSTKMFQVIQQDLGLAGIKVTGVPAEDADFYTKFLQRPDESARKGQWDLSLAGWGPDWYGNAALSFFSPLFDGRVEPPTSSNFGLFNSDDVNQCIDAAQAATSDDAANAKWGECDKLVMQHAAFFPISDPNEGTIAGKQVHNTVYMPQFQTFDYTNVWLDKNAQGG